MCTVTIVPVRGPQTAAARAGYRLACNRDESRLRPAALPPQVRAIDGRYVVLPVDPVAGGTWVAVNDHGLAMTLLNVYAPMAAGDGSPAPLQRLPHHRSRGLIIPTLIASDHVTAALNGASALRATDFPPFRLVMVDFEQIAEIRSDGFSFSTSVRPRPGEPVLFTSSGLGDHVVEPPRRELFRAMFAEPGRWLAAQDEFHRHRWPDRPHLSVCMDRPEARTVSYTVIDVAVGSARLTYSGEPPDLATEPFVVGIESPSPGYSVATATGSSMPSNNAEPTRM